MDVGESVRGEWEVFPLVLESPPPSARRWKCEVANSRIFGFENTRRLFSKVETAISARKRRFLVKWIFGMPQFRKVEEHGGKAVV